MKATSTISFSRMVLVVVFTLLAIPPTCAQTQASSQVLIKSATLISKDVSARQVIHVIKGLPNRNKRHAIIIGVDRYIADESISTLRGASRDAKALADALVNYADFPAENVELLTSEQTTERQPTKSNIYKRLINKQGLLQKDELLVIAFSGHGLEKEGKGLLLPADALANPAVIEDFAMPVTTLEKLIKQTGAGQVILILDASRNDPFRGRGLQNFPLSASYAAPHHNQSKVNPQDSTPNTQFSFDLNHGVEVFAVIYATSLGQRAWENRDTGLGYFTSTLVEGLRGSASNKFGAVTLGSLLRYLESEVPIRVERDIGRKQRPFAIVEGYRPEELVIVGKLATAPAQKDSRATSKPSEGPNVELAFWEAIKNSTDIELYSVYLRKYPHGQFAEQAVKRLQLLSGNVGSGTKAAPQPVKVPAMGEYHALVIGNNRYQSMPRLYTAENDAKEVADILRKQYGFKVNLLLNATRQQILAAFSEYRRTLVPDTNLLIYYAGHGEDDVDIETAFWLPVDAGKDDNSNWISSDDITKNVKGIPSRHVLIISDSCFAGAIMREGNHNPSAPAVRERFLQRISEFKSRTLMASGGNEPVEDGGSGGHSIFADALIRGLRLMAMDAYTAEELFQGFILESVTGNSDQTPMYSPLRNSGHGGGDFIFIRRK
jgi:uncharacterized caspase-like protein